MGNPKINQDYKNLEIQYLFNQNKINDLEKALMLRDKIDKINNKNSSKVRQKEFCKIIIEQEKIIRELNENKNTNNDMQINKTYNDNKNRDN
jgi:hypothetical protein